MAYILKGRDDHFSNDGEAKRILALDGGGLKGIFTIGILQKIEDLLRERHGGDENFRLCHYFDLIAGTSTGAIIAAALALGWSVEKVRKTYMQLGEKVFEKSLLRKGLLRAKYDEKELSEELKKAFGPGTTLGSEKLKTGLLIITKRLDTGSPWPLGNNPRGQYFKAGDGGVVGNKDYPLWQVVRASTAAPGFFDPENISIISKPGYRSVQGNFVDGGISPFNNPALQALMYTTMDGYRVGWPTGADKLLLVSLGTGAVDPEVKRANIAAKHAINALLSLMDDCAALQETLLQWMSSSSHAREIDDEIGCLEKDLISKKSLLSYRRYNVDLREKSVQELYPSLTDSETIKSLSEMDAPENMEILHELGKLAAETDVQPEDFPSEFDLPVDQNKDQNNIKTRKKYRKKADSYVIAVQFNLETDGFQYHKWGAEQQSKKGDWIVDNNGETYTVDNEVFQKTYRNVDPGKYVKTTAVWAEIATEPGSVTTKEGESHYSAGDYIVYNNQDGTDAYCMSTNKFESMYEPAG